MATRTTLVSRNVVAAAAAGAVLLAACGRSAVQTGTAAPDGSSGGSQAAIVARIQAAPAATLAQKTARVTETDGSGDPQDPSNTSTSSGSYNFATNQSEVHQSDGSGEPSTTIFDNGVIYDNSPGSVLLGAKPWRKTDLNAVSQTASPAGAIGQMLATVTGFENAGPTMELLLLNAVTGTVTTVGSESVAGVPTTHYRFAVDMPTLIHLALPQMPATLRPLMEQAMQTGPMAGTTMVADVWLDDQGLVRKLHDRETDPVDPALAGSGVSTPSTAPAFTTSDTTFVFSSFGKPVTITIPPASQVTDMTQMFSQPGGVPSPGDLSNLLGGSDG